MLTQITLVDKKKIRGEWNFSIDSQLILPFETKLRSYLNSDREMTVILSRLATLRYKPFRYNAKSQYGTGIYKRTKDVTVYNNHFGTIQQKH